MKFLIIFIPVLMFADAKGEIDTINELLEEKYVHKVDFVNENTKRLIKLDVETVKLLEETIVYKKSLIRINTFFRYENEEERIINGEN